jgi:antirestriction protein
MPSIKGNEPSIYVGTYAKYNNGSIAGKWLVLSDFDSRDEFYEACKELHKDEADPEYMFQDYQGFPKAFYSESSVQEELWDWLALDEDDQKLLEVYKDNVNQEGGIEEARDAFAGQYNSKAAWAEEHLEDTGELETVPESLKNYIDYEAYARDAEYSGTTFIRVDGDLWVFYG